jgi:predicted nucleic acid-binding protein
MEIIYSPTLIPSLKNRHLLLDTNVFRDMASKPTVFADFFNLLKNEDVTLTTLDVVKYEILKGSRDNEKYKEKEKQIDAIIDIVLPIIPGEDKLIYELIKQYEIDGTAISITDLFLGATLMQYKKNIFLMTRDTTDFMQNIFDLKFIVNAPHKKGIFTYGIYQYSK